MSAVPTLAARIAAETISLPRVVARRLALPVLFVAGPAYHFLQSRGHATPAVCALAIATRIQFVVLPLGYFAAVAICGRGAYRRHVVPAALTAVLLGALIGLPGLLGQYGAANFGHASPDGLAHWTLLNA